MFCAEVLINLGTCMPVSWRGYIVKITACNYMLPSEMY